MLCPYNPMLRPYSGRPYALTGGLAEFKRLPMGDDLLWFYLYDGFCQWQGAGAMLKHIYLINLLIGEIQPR